MKQLAFMILATLLGTLGVVVISPFCGVFVYYLFAVLRPQYIWKWSLPEFSWSFYVALATIIGCVLAAFGIVPAERRQPGQVRHVHRMTICHGFFAAYACWVMVTYITARDHDAAYPWFLEYTKIFLMYFVSSYLIRSVRQVWVLFCMTGLALGYIAYEVNFMYIVHRYLGIQKNGYGGLDNNGAGLMLAIGVPICWFVFEGMRRWWRWLFLPLIPVLVHAVLMTYSRGAMLSLLVMCPLMVLRSRYRVRLTVLLVLFSMGLLPVLAGPEIRSRFLTIKEHEIDASANSRWRSWKAAFDMASDNPVFGVGVRNANLFSYQYGADMEGRTIHSQYLQIAADNGFVGLSLYLLVLAGAWMALRRVGRMVDDKDEEVQQAKAIAYGLECALVVFCSGAFFLSLEVFELPFLLLLLCAQLQLVSGAVDRHLHAPREDEREATIDSPEMGEVSYC